MNDRRTLIIHVLLCTAVGEDEIEEQITAPQCMPALTKHAPKVPQLGRANCLPLSKQLPCQQQPDVW